MNRTVLELDLMSYSDIATVLEENLNVEAVKAFEDQIQAFVDHGLDTLALTRQEVVLGAAGDNAILVFNDAATMHKFAHIVQGQTSEHNRSKSTELAKRWFRMGAATGAVLVLESERRIVGSTIGRAVRLEAAANRGELLVDLPTFDALPNELKRLYGNEEMVQGKRQERFKARRCRLIDVSNLPAGEGDDNTRQDRREPAAPKSYEAMPVQFRPGDLLYWSYSDGTGAASAIVLTTSVDGSIVRLARACNEIESEQITNGEHGLKTRSGNVIAFESPAASARAKSSAQRLLAQAESFFLAGGDKHLVESNRLEGLAAAQEIIDCLRVLLPATRE